MKKFEKISLIIITYNRRLLLNEILKKIKLQSGVKVEVIVVDDGSVPASIDENLMTYYVWKRDVGYHRVELLNIAINLVKSDYVVFLDDDVIPQSNRWLKMHLDNLKDNEVTKGIVEYFKYDEDNIKYIEKYDFVDGVFGKLYSVLNLGIRTELLKQLGGFDEIYDGEYGYDDIDFIAKILFNNRKIKFIADKNSIVHHVGKIKNLDDFGNKDPKDKKNGKKYYEKWGVDNIIKLEKGLKFDNGLLYYKR